jgi:hypothetical protein
MIHLYISAGQFTGLWANFIKKRPEGLKIEACALKSFCGSVEMMASILSSANSGLLLPVPGLEKEHINRAAVHVPVANQREFGELM